MKTRRRIPAWLPGAVISLGLIAWLVTRFDWEQVAAALAAADGRWLLAALLVNLLWLMLRSQVWAAALPDPVHPLDAFLGINVGYTLNTFFPFRLGEVGRVYWLARKIRQDFWRLLPSVFLERAVDLLFAALFLLAALGFVALDEGARSLALLVGGGVMLGLLLLAGLLWQQEHWLPLLQQRFPSGPVNRLLVTIEKMLSGLATLQQGGQLFRFLVLLALNWLLAIGQYICILRAFFPVVPWWWGLVLLAGVAFGVAVPALPGSLGTLEAAGAGVVFLLTGQEGLALAVGVALRLFNGLVALPFGFWALLRLGQSPMQLYRQLRRVSGEESHAAYS